MLAVRRGGQQAVFFALWCLGAAAAADIRVEDYQGRSVSLQAAASRIVALAPHIVENLYSAGAGEQIVGAAQYSNYPPPARHIPRVGSYTAFSMETIAALAPDLVIVWGSGNGAGVVQQLGQLGVAVYIDEPRKLSDVARSIRDFGQLAGTAAVSEPQAAAYLQQLAALRKQFSTATPVSVLYQVWHEPLQTLSGEHLISDVIRLCGGTNAYADAVSLAPKISLESVFQRDPQVIIASGMAAGRPPWLDNWRRWPQLQAVRYDNLYFVPADIIQRHTLRILSGVTMLCEHLQRSRLKTRAQP